VNNQPVAATSDGQGWVAEVPVSTVTAMGEGRLVLSMAPETLGQPLVLTRVDLSGPDASS
jgi:hypothetical protein